MSRTPIDRSPKVVADARRLREFFREDGSFAGDLPGLRRTLDLLQDQDTTGQRVPPPTGAGTPLVKTSRDWNEFVKLAGAVGFLFDTDPPPRPNDGADRVNGTGAWGAAGRVADSAQRVPDAGPVVKPIRGGSPEDRPSVSLVDGGALLGEEARGVLESEILPRYLMNQRWFGAKSSGLEKVAVRDWCRLVDAPGPGDFVTVDATTGDGRTSTYVVPVLLDPGGAEGSAPLVRPASVMARAEWPGGEGFVIDATATDEFCLRLLDLIDEAGTVETAGGRLTGLPTTAFGEAGGSAGARKVARGSVEQSNTTLVFGGRYLMKLFRRIEPGVNPDYEIGRFLTERTDFRRVPRTLGAVEYRRPPGGPATLAILQDFVKSEGQGWEWLLGVLAHDLSEVAAGGARSGPIAHPPSDWFGGTGDDPPAEVLAVVGKTVGAAGVLGKTTGDLHVALASAPDDPDFARQPLSPDDLEALGRRVVAQAGATFDALRRAGPGLAGELRAAADLVLDLGPARVDRVAGGVVSATGSSKIRVHGDYHLGQVLRQGDDFIILDFEGEPSRPLADRRAKQSPLRDVAGMLRSFDYAAAAALHAAARPPSAGADPGGLAGSEAWARGWSAWASAEFVRGYLRAVGPSGLLPADPASASLLLTAFLLEKLLFEVTYELSYRPDWVRIPLLALGRLLTSDG